MLSSAINFHAVFRLLLLLNTLEMLTQLEPHESPLPQGMKIGNQLEEDDAKRGHGGGRRRGGRGDNIAGTNKQTRRQRALPATIRRIKRDSLRWD